MTSYRRERRPPGTEEYFRQNPRPPVTSIHMLHIQWKLFGLLSECIEIAQDARDPSSICRPYTATDPLVNWPATAPPVASLTVEVDDPINAEEYFLDQHLAHAGQSSEWVRVPPPIEDKTMRARGTRPFWGDDDKGNVLAKCCGESRPRIPPKLTVTSSCFPFVTIDDYVTAVHPWLQTLKNVILYGKEVLNDSKPFPVDTPLYVMLLRPQTIDNPLDVRCPGGVGENRTPYTNARDLLLGDWLRMGYWSRSDTCVSSL
ncbi:hypothetical protein K461DRAFT_183673 [Myriangium duriaei CBS 260.36]|uniref:Uncharacterized protein n=1 Tax=Myriangium duriaei CBS 260.36 TaxID=1168546 RepID=A0A9P4ME75_9PEZI|nr:hypothetical protein K461DRAFT_183673 [Myriangium duriaei CBS 260.36]